MAGQPWTDADDDALRAHHAAGGSLHAFCAEHDRAKSTVSRKAKALGLAFGAERTARTRAATEANQATNAERRAALITRLYGQADRYMDRIDGERYRTLVRLAGGAQTTRDLSFVPSEDLRNTTSSVSNVLTAAARLEGVADRSAAAADQRSMVLDLITGLREQAPVEP